MRLLKFIALVLVLLAGLPRPLAAQGFSALVSPPRFEIAVKPGVVTRQVMEITNASPLPATFRVHTSDWTFDPDATVTLLDVLGSGSCRPWVAIEAREVTIRSGGKYRYRFEINPPADATGECRFAVVVEGLDEQVDAGGNLRIPINGRLGIIVYATLPGAEPKLEVVESEVAAVNGQMLPVLHVRNSGTAHGRIAGLLAGTDASGKRIDFTPSGLPILPNETRRIVLGVSGEGSQAVKIAYPITIRGNLEWGDKSTPLDQRFAP